MHNFQLLSVAVVIFFIILSLMKIHNDKDIDNIIEPVISGISTLFSILIFLWNFQLVDSFISSFLMLIFKNTIGDNGVVHIILLLLSFVSLKLFLFYAFKFINSLMVYSHLEESNNKNPFLIVIVGSFGLIRGLIFLVLIILSVVIYNGSVQRDKQIREIQSLKVYKNIENLIDSNRISVVTNGVMDNISNNKTIYYNGITVDEGVKSNKSIKETAEKVTLNTNSHREKAYEIYKWIGTNIIYDDEKAEAVMELNGGCESGAIIAFNEKKGICFDFSCLFTAMARDVGLKSRVIVGDGFNGSEYVNHAWNQVYLEEEEKWINLDVTFYNAGEYFDNYNFNDDHILEKIAGEY